MATSTTCFDEWFLGDWKRVPRVELVRYIVIDFETYSLLPLGKIRKLQGVGGHRYAKHKSTEVLALGFAILDKDFSILSSNVLVNWREVTLFLRTTYPNAIWVAHNAQFDRIIMEYQEPSLLTPIPLDKWHCTQSHALLAGLSPGLGKLSEALNLVKKKDKERGDRVINRLKLVPFTKETCEEIRSDRPFMEELAIYCEHDVEATVELLKFLWNRSPFSRFEKALYCLDQKINNQGIKLDLAAIRIIDTQIDKNAGHLKERVNAFSEGNMVTATQTKYLTHLMVDYGILLPNLRKETVKAYLQEPNIPYQVEKLLKLRLEASHAAIKKYKMMKARVSEDGRLRGEFIYHGTQTGRWSSRGVQVQNLMTYEGLNKANFLKRCQKVPPTEGFLSKAGSLVRTMLVAKRGYFFNNLDYSSIEPRLLFWISKDEQGLSDILFDVYLKMAGDIFKENIIDKADPRRAIGKAAFIGSGYGLGPERCAENLPDGFGDKEELAQVIIDTFRARYASVVLFWRLLDAGVKNALMCPKQEFFANGVKLCLRSKSDLVISLPSGSELHYFRPAMRLKKMKSKRTGEIYTKEVLSYITNGGIRADTWGGKLTENIVQRLARDVLAYGMLRLDQAGFNIVLHVHDEIMCEEEEDRLAEMGKILAIMPPWLNINIPSDGQVSTFYSK